MAKVRSWAGLDVHARSVVAVTLDALLSMLADRKNQAETQSSHRAQYVATVLSRS